MVELPVPEPLWLADTPRPDRRGASLPERVDVVVVGAGIAGLTTAALLARSGRGVAVLEAATVGAGTTGHTTAKVSTQHGLIYAQLTRDHGAEAAARYARAQVDALDWIRREVAEHAVDCALETRDSFVYTTRPERRAELEAEVQAAQAAGLPADLFETVDLPLDVVGAVRFREQAQFHPVRWLLHLAGQSEAAGATVVEGVRVQGVRRRSAGHLVETTAGPVLAEHVVVATQFPILDRGGFFARLVPTRDLVVHGPVRPSSVPGGMYLSADDGHSIRTAPGPEGADELVVGGEHYRTGARTDVEERYRRLADWARGHFGMESVRHRWSAHDLSTPDRLPYVGRYAPGTTGLWVATGFGQWGMTNGTAAGLLLDGLISGTADPGHAALLDPARVSARAVPGVAKANAEVAAHLGSDLARATLTSASLADLALGEARVGRDGRHLVAAYRDAAGTLHAVAARCTHLGCVVQFNNAEKSWDCPCHASRFGLDGEVLCGPATSPLERYEPS